MKETRIKPSNPLAKEIDETQRLLCVLLNPNAHFNTAGVKADVPEAERKAIEATLKNEQEEIMELTDTPMGRFMGDVFDSSDLEDARTCLHLGC